MCRLPTLLLLCLLTVPAASAQAQLPVDLELVLAADGSGSIDDEEFRLQRNGYAEAISHPRVLTAIASGYRRRIAIAFMEWGAPESQHVIVDWTMIDGREAAEAFAAKLLSAPRAAYGYNSISNAIAFSRAMIAGNDYEGQRMVIDLSGDGPQIGGAPLEAVRSETLRDGITINALMVDTPGGHVAGPLGEPLSEHYRRDVVGGPGHFVMIAKGREEFARAILNKLVQEIADSGARAGRVILASEPHLQERKTP